MAAVGKDIDNALCGDPVCLFGCNGKTLFAEIFDSFIEVAFGFDKRFFAFHHAAACLLAELHYVFCGNISHFESS